MNRQPASLARLTLLAGLASTQLTLLMRAGMAPFAIMASLSWLGGGLLLVEQEDKDDVLELGRILRRRLFPGVLLLLWALLVLSFAARLYDPLLHLVPVASLLGLALALGARWRSRLVLELTVIALLLPAQVLINRFLPTAQLAAVTAWVSAFLLWLVGQPALSEGDRIVMQEQILVVDASCTGVNTMALCLAATLLLVLLIPPPSWRWGRSATVAIMAMLALVLAFAVNAIRVALLGLTTHDPPKAWYGSLMSFDFWHDGGGSNLFSLTAMGLVCGLYVLALEVALRRSRPRQSRPS
ncbi:archaeosortase/exosortase family protein [Synechococcus sp. 1G10]|uniref:archaeosortase/exosortase family protein n=1 Tax=Synechococcus sp. 1G10 TaxID=2025605 RepID=UPI000B97FF87|nr:archaeosortase/exosortase family protein [Synechococcus sp. 1G10]